MTARHDDAHGIALLARLAVLPARSTQAAGTLNQQAKVAAGVADNRRDRLSIGKIPIWVNDPQLRPLARQDVLRLVRS